MQVDLPLLPAYDGAMKAPETNRLGTYVRDRRAELQLSQEGLAERAGVSRQAISQIELGQIRLSASTARRLARALRMGPNGTNRLIDLIEPA